MFNCRNINTKVIGFSNNKSKVLLYSSCFQECLGYKNNLLHGDYIYKQLYVSI